jgi:hypothetical protein
MAATIRRHSAADEELKLETEAAQATGLTTRAKWWRLGLIALLIVVAVLLALQLMGGNTGTDVIPGTPIAAPQNNVPVPAA